MTAPSPAAVRMRRTRERRRQRDVILSLEVGPSETADLVDLGWLPAPDHRGVPSCCRRLGRAGRCDAQHWRGRSSPASSRSTICRVIPAEVSGRSEADEGVAPERECQPEVRTQSQRNVHVPGQCP
jgi:hypothetical protein